MFHSDRSVDEKKTDFLSLYEDRELEGIVQSGYIPVIERVDGNVFISTTSIYYRDLEGRSYVKYLLLDSNKKITNDSSYRYARLLPGYYLIRLSLPTSFPSPEGILIDYAIKCDDVHMQSVATTDRGNITYGFTSINMGDPGMDERLNMTPKNREWLFGEYFKYEFNITNTYKPLSR